MGSVCAPGRYFIDSVSMVADSPESPATNKIVITGVTQPACCTSMGSNGSPTPIMLFSSSMEPATLPMVFLPNP